VHGLEADVQLLPAYILRLRAGQGVEAALLDAVDELAWLARGGDDPGRYSPLLKIEKWSIQTCWVKVGLRAGPPTADYGF
jgi:hypothetical protein